jgi:hypothetical protein
MPSTTAKAAISQTRASAPAPGATNKTMPNSTDAIPLSASSHSLRMTCRRRTAAITSKTPVTTPQAGMMYTRTRAGQATRRSPRPRRCRSRPRSATPSGDRGSSGGPPPHPGRRRPVHRRPRATPPGLPGQTRPDEGQHAKEHGHAERAPTSGRQTGVVSMGPAMRRVYLSLRHPRGARGIP